jgi:hypothetical protein
MKDKFEATLLESADVFKKGFLYIGENIGKAIALITLVVSALVLFTDISFRDFGLKSFTSTMLVMLLASYLMYFSMEEAGEKLGAESKEYKSARLRLSELADRIGGDKIYELRSFCKKYSEEELVYRRSNFLFASGLSDEDYEAYKNGEAFERKIKRALKRADKLKAFSLTPTLLISKEGKLRDSELSSPEKRKLFSMALKLIPTTVCSLLTVSIMFTAKENIGASAIIDGLFKLSALIVIGFKGYTAGYAYSRITLPLWFETKARLLSAFLSSFGANP